MNGKNLSYDDNLIGSKANSLIKLKESGFNVPDFRVLRKVDCKKENIDIALNCFSNGTIFAIRSSCISEDGLISSKAGKYYSAINIPRERVFEEVENVLKSYNDQGGGVIIQKFIDSDRAGVIFTDAGSEKVVINASLGLCDSVVKGESCDEYILEKSSGKLVGDRLIGLQSSLDKSHIFKIYNEALRIEKFFGCPQDIEFCFLNGELFILQSRPITRKIFKNIERTYYDSANIAESYSGIVLPLTISFAKKVYSVVYKDLLVASGVPRKKMDQHTDIFDSLIASFLGRMYYNMNSWYSMMSFIPGYERNKRNLELMITSNRSEKSDQLIKPNVIFLLFYYILVFFKIIFLPLTIFLFKKNTRDFLKKIKEKPIDNFSLEECKDLYFSLINGPLRKWYITVENDTVLMGLFGLVHKKNPKRLKNLQMKQATISASQVEDLKRLSDAIMSDHELKEAVLVRSDVKFFEALNRKKIIEKLYKDYFDIYGGRYANELKLESEDLQENFNKFSNLVELYSTNIQIRQEKQINSKLTITERFINYFVSNREEMRLLRTNMFSIVRKIFMRMGNLLATNRVITEAEDVFYLELDELLTHIPKNLKNIIEGRKNQYKKYNSLNPLTHFIIENGNSISVNSDIIKSEKLTGVRSSPGILRGRVRVFKNYELPDKIDFDIIVTSHTDPGWVPLIGLSKGLIIEHGGLLSHASIVSRELGIPAIIGVKNATILLSTGDIVSVTEEGEVIIVNDNE